MKRSTMVCAAAIVLGGCATQPAEQATAKAPAQQQQMAGSAPLKEPARTGTRLRSGNSDRSVRTIDSATMRLDTVESVGAPPDTR